MAKNLINSNDIEVETIGSNLKLDLSQEVHDQLDALGDYVVDSMAGNEQNKAPSVSSVKNYIDGNVLYEDDNGDTSITLSDSANNYSRFIISCTISNEYFQDFIIENSDNQKIIGIQTAGGQSIGSRLSINDTNMSLSILYREYYVSAVIKIIKVIGYK